MEDVNKYYYNRWKVKFGKYMKLYVFGSWKFLTLLAAIVLLLLTTLQAFCSDYNCRGEREERRKLTCEPNETRKRDPVGFHDLGHPTGRSYQPIKLERTAAQATSVAVNFVEVWTHHCLSYTPHVTSFHFPPTPSPETSVLAVSDRWKAQGFGSTIRRHHRAWEVTAGTIGLTEGFDLPIAVD
ncbi:hypothetical protein WN943_022664 [Citrus x changshan-huyou]